MSKSKEVELPEWIDNVWLDKFRVNLLEWYDRAGRTLPWRETDSPWAILVSEIMLQQTQAATVIPYYHRFLARFPTPQSLALADEQDVLQMWQGLGYYRRAKSLRNAAIMIAKEYGGRFPRSFENILALPGVGRYTAGAVASFAFNASLPVVEANTQRLHARLLKLQNPLHLSASQQRLWGLAEKILDKDHAASINHAVMDLGAMICTPKDPSCLICPLREICETAKGGLQAAIPVAKPKKVYVDLLEVAVALFQPNGELLMWQRPEDGWWAGLWDLPRRKVSSTSRRQLKAVEEWIWEQSGVDCTINQELSSFRHTVTHHRITAKLFSAVIREDFHDGIKKIGKSAKKLSVREIRPNRFRVDTISEKANTDVASSSLVGAWKWVGGPEQSDMPLSSSGRRMVRWLSAQTYTNQR